MGKFIHMKHKQNRIRLGALLALFAVLLVVYVMTDSGRDQAWAREFNMATTQPAGTNITVQVFNDQGKLVGPVYSQVVIKTDAQWKEQLGADRFDILRRQGTEPPGSCQLLKNKADGVYICAGCDLPLFTSKTKFESGTGWPSYFDAIKPNVATHTDTSHGMKRVEIHCTRCKGHLGHVFEDGPKPTGLRYCVDGLSLQFTKTENFAKLADPAAKATPVDQLKTVIVAGGCFWCTEAVFESVNGVHEVISGYAGGDEKTANYQMVCSGKTDHAEAIKIVYDAKLVSYEKLLELFFTIAHDPTQLNGQGNDIGPQYRSAVFVHDDAEKAIVQKYIDKLDASKNFDKPVVTTIEPLTIFYDAEKYHQDYARLNPSNPYIQGIAGPKLRKLQAKHSDLLKKIAGDK